MGGEEWGWSGGVRSGGGERGWRVGCGGEEWGWRVGCGGEEWG